MLVASKSASVRERGRHCESASMRPVDVEEFNPSVDQYAFTFGGVGPLRRVRPGTALRVWSDDAFGGRLRAVTDLSTE